MASVRERALNAGVELVGEGGVRALTHARVDERAGLPRGSTSNHFRTRAALMAGVIAWIAERERDDFGTFDGRVDSPAALVDSFTLLVDLQTSQNAGRTRARYALFLEAVGRPALDAPLREQRALFEQWVSSLFVALDAPDPVAAARTLMACCEGLIMHRLTVDPDVPIRPVLARAVRGALSPDA